ncbi:hypothetical protein IWX49DRAFT_169695 [Phyllosticta citricarpa]|uniref:Uncharacterized protein n=2 Tax=Phyllosticta TaxID=121621 RepID=A0ABR1M2T5_9PEZI
MPTGTNIAISSSLLFLFSLHRLPTYLPTPLALSSLWWCSSQKPASTYRHGTINLPTRPPPSKSNSNNPTNHLHAVHFLLPTICSALARPKVKLSHLRPTGQTHSSCVPDRHQDSPQARHQYCNFLRCVTTDYYVPYCGLSHRCFLLACLLASAAAAALIHHQHSHVVDGVEDERGSEETRKEEKTREEEQEQGKCRRTRERRERKAVKRRGIRISDGDDYEDELGHDADDKTS